MAKKPFVPPRIAPLQRVVAEPITDPAEQATLDACRKQQQGGSSAGRLRTNGRLKAGPARVLELCRRLPAQERPALLARLASQLDPEVQLECLAPLLAALPPALLRQLEEELRPRLRTGGRGC
jgi:hypothetical protein